ncbi:hypothetical protein Q9R32_16240 [Actinotalea sp. AC32]|nr:hypothetical protein [Actinotalea sp. AC32]
MLLVAWLGVCAVLAWTTRRRPLVALVAVLVVWVAVPVAATELVTGRGTGPLGAHPASWLTMAVVAAQLAHAPRRILRVTADHVFLVLALGLVAAVATFTTQQSGTGGIALLLDMVVAPLVLFVLLLTVVDGDAPRLDAVRTALLALGAASSLLAVLQWVTGSVLVYEAQHSTQWWFDPEKFDRWMATFDHPLTLSMFLCVTSPLIVGLRRASLQLGLVALFAAAVTITQSRSGVVIVGVVAVWVVLRSRAPSHVRLLSLCLLAAGAAALLASGLAEGVGARFADDTGSTGARTDALRFFGETWTDYLLIGHGLTSSYGIAAQSGLVASLENSFLMYAVDIGTVFAIVYFGAQAALVVRSWTRPVQLPGARQAALIAFVLPLTYSGLAARSATATILWVALGLAVARRRADVPGAGDPHAVAGYGDGAVVPKHDRAVVAWGSTRAGRTGQGAVPVPLSRRTVTADPSSS